MDRCVGYEVGMDSGTCSYGFDMEGSDCLETVSRLFAHAARIQALDQGSCTPWPLS